MSGGGRIIACSECGHLHFDTGTAEYVPCPLRGDVRTGLGCRCPFRDGTGSPTTNGGET